MLAMKEREGKTALLKSTVMVNLQALAAWGVKDECKWGSRFSLFSYV